MKSNSGLIKISNRIEQFFPFSNRQFVAIFIVSVIVAKNGVVDKAQVFENFEQLCQFRIELNIEVTVWFEILNIRTALQV